MIQWDRNKHEINNGFEFNPGDDATVEQINGTINNALYSVDFADGLTETPEVENPNPEASPTVSLVDYVKEIEGVQKTLKKFKFTNIKGQRGEKGEKGDKGDSAVSFRVGSVVTLPAGSDATATNIGTNQDVVLDLGIPKGDKGDTPVLEFDSKPTENSSKLVNSGTLYKYMQYDLVSKYLTLDSADYVYTKHLPGASLQGMYYLILEIGINLIDLGIHFLGYTPGTSNRKLMIPFSYHAASNQNSKAAKITYTHSELTVPPGDAFLFYDDLNRQTEADYKVYVFSMERNGL